MTSDAWPEELKLSRGGQSLIVTFDSGETFTYAAEFLRVESPSAEVKGHTPEQAVTVAGKRRVLIARLLPVGNYAVRVVFDDGHDTGLYAWPYLLKLGREMASIWQNYLDALAAKGLTRG